VFSAFSVASAGDALSGSDGCWLPFPCPSAPPSTPAPFALAFAGLGPLWVRAGRGVAASPLPPPVPPSPPPPLMSPQPPSPIPVTCLPLDPCIPSPHPPPPLLLGLGGSPDPRSHEQDPRSAILDPILQSVGAPPSVVIWLAAPFCPTCLRRPPPPVPRCPAPPPSIPCRLIRFTCVSCPAPFHPQALSSSVLCSSSTTEWRPKDHNQIVLGQPLCPARSAFLPRH
jgi:hypothetical protein